MTGKLILLRHGESEWNNKNLFCGWVDVSLTEKGQTQARKAGELILRNGLKPNILYTSKLKRSCQTAQIIIEKLDRLWLDVIRSWRLNERHYGALQGRLKSEVVKEVGKEKYMYWRRAYEGCPPLMNDDQENQLLDERYLFSDISLEEYPRGESLKMVVERVRPIWEDSIKRELKLGKTVLLVTHGSIVRSLIKIVSGISDKDIEFINIPNGIPLVYEFDEHLHKTKDYFYLDPEAAVKGAAEVAVQGLECQSV